MGYNKSDREYLLKIGSRIRQLREAAGLSQEQLSFECGLHRTYISSIERGERNVAVINLRRIADALGVPVIDLFAFDELSSRNKLK